MNSAQSDTQFNEIASLPQFAVQSNDNNDPQENGVNFTNIVAGQKRKIALTIKQRKKKRPSLPWEVGMYLKFI